MKRIGNLYHKIIEFSNLRKALLKAIRNKHITDEMQEFCYHQETELVVLQKELLTKTYKPLPYNIFTIYEPKKRIIHAAQFRDRVVHHAICRIIEPYLERKFIAHSYACRKGKGSHAAIYCAQTFSQKSAFYFKSDIRKYFDSIPHENLRRCLSHHFKDTDLLWLFDIIIDSSVTIPHITLEQTMTAPNIAPNQLMYSWQNAMETPRGIPLGNLTSQFFANLYLNDMDHLIQDRCGISSYVRYMDDFVLWADQQKILREAEQAIIELLKSKGLELKSSATMLRRTQDGLPFLGFRIYPNKIKIKRENWKKFVRKFGIRHCEFIQGKLSKESFQTAIASLLGHVCKGETRGLLQKFLYHFAKKFKKKYQLNWLNFLAQHIPKYVNKHLYSLMNKLFHIHLHN